MCVCGVGWGGGGMAGAVAAAAACPSLATNGCVSYWRPTAASPLFKSLTNDFPVLSAGKYVTGDINEAYLRNLEEQGRGKRKGARPGRKTASLVSRGQPAEASSSNGSGQAGKQPAPAA